MGKWAAILIVMVPALAWAGGGEVAIVNGTDDGKATGKLQVLLEDWGYDVVRTGSTPGESIRKKSGVWCRKEQIESFACIDLASKLLPDGGRPRSLAADSEDEFVVVIGEDLLDWLDRQPPPSGRPRKRTFRRSGFLIGLGMGGGYLGVLPKEGDGKRSGGAMSSFEIGGAIRDRVALMYRVAGGVGTAGSAFSDTFAARVFFPHGTYVAGGLGLGRLESGDAEMRWGFGYLVDAGIEWPLLTHFVLGTELSHSGQIVGGDIGFVVGARAAARWYWPGRKR